MSALRRVVIVCAAALSVGCGAGEPGQAPGSSGAIDGMEGMPGMGGATTSGPSTIRLTAGQIRSFGVAFGGVEERTLEREIRAAGVVAFDETRVFAVTLKVGGYVEQLHVDFTGRPVRAGEALVEVYSPELVSAQEDLLLAYRIRQSLGDSSIPGVTGGFADLVGPARRRLALQDISEAQMDAVVERGAPMRTLSLYSPVTGIVIEKNVVQGQAIAPGQTLFRVADLSRVWIEAELREADAGMVREGDVASIEFGALPGPPISARVEYVEPTVQDATRTLRVRMSLANPGRALRPGMFATVRLVTLPQTALTVATSAIIRTGERSLAFVDLGDGRLAPVEVRTGRVDGGLTEVLQGLEPGQRVVTSAQYLLDSESNLAEVMRAMMAQISLSDVGSADMGGMDMGGPEPRGANVRSLIPPPQR